jgi:hypothetical protein
MCVRGDFIGRDTDRVGIDLPNIDAVCEGGGYQCSRVAF